MDHIGYGLVRQRNGIPSGMSLLKQTGPKRELGNLQLGASGRQRVNVMCDGAHCEVGQVVEGTAVLSGSDSGKCPNAREGTLREWCAVTKSSGWKASVLTYSCRESQLSPSFPRSSSASIYKSVTAPCLPPRRSCSQNSNSSRSCSPTHDLSCLWIEASPTWYECGLLHAIPLIRVLPPKPLPERIVCGWLFAKD